MTEPTSSWSPLRNLSSSSADNSLFSASTRLIVSDCNSFCSCSICVSRSLILAFAACKSAQPRQTHHKHQYLREWFVRLVGRCVRGPHRVNPTTVLVHLVQKFPRLSVSFSTWTSRFPKCHSWKLKQNNNRTIPYLFARNNVATIFYLFQKAKNRPNIH